MTMLAFLAVCISRVIASEQNQVQFHTHLLDLIDTISHGDYGWEAGVNARFHNYTIDDAKGLMGVGKMEGPSPLSVKNMSVKTDLPTDFNSITAFPHCPSIADIWDQAACASCYVLATVMSAADRMCIATNGTLTQRLSAEHMLACCHTCGFGCGEGFPPYAWAWMASHGVVSGGPYRDKKYCSAYSLTPCDHHVKGRFPSCGAPDKTPTCPTACDEDTSWPTKFDEDLIKFKTSYQLPTDDASIQTEIMTHGPVAAQMNVYSDFLTYKSGVYQAMGGSDLGGHAVRIIGWGTMNTKPYWLVANSWNSDWGDKGYFKILRGNCGINLGVYGGEYN